MKKILNLILCSILIITTFSILETPVFNFVIDVQADQYAMACGNYEVAIANSNGTFSKQACFNDFGSAKNSMYGYGDDAVVRHGSSKSPMKIIAMVSGLAITYPSRSNSATMNIYQDVNHQYKKVTYVTNHREMHYESTYSYNGGGNGTIKVNVTGFSGITDLVNTDLVPSIFTRNDVRVLLGGNTTTSKPEEAFWTHVYQSHYAVSQNGSNKELIFKAYSGWSDGSTYPAVYTMTVGLAADWMSVGSTYYSYDGYNFYTDAKYKNKIGTYHNYYQFLPTRTKSNIPASVFDNYLVTIKGTNTNSKMKGQGQTFINAQNTYGMNALLIYALSCLESAYGTSNFALERNNLFGWNAFDSDPGQASSFPSIEVAVNEHMGINLRGYTDINDSRFFGSHVGNKGSGFNVKYAADPYWGYKIASIAYAIDKASGFQDYNKYSVGLINTYGINVLKSPNGAVLHNSAYGATYQENFTVVLLGNESNNYKIQTTNPLSGGNLITGTIKGLVNYDWNNSVGYVANGHISTLNTNTPPQPSGTSPTGDFVGTVSNAVISKEGKLTIEGLAYRPGIYVTDKNTILQKVTMIDTMFRKSDVPVTTTVSDNDKVKYSFSLDLNALTEGDYYFKVRTDYAVLGEYNQEITLEKLATYPAEVVVGTKKYKLYALGNLVKLSVSDSTIIPPTPTTPAEVEKVLKHEIKSFDRTDNLLSITGFAFITGINAIDSTTVKHELYLTNLETKEVFPFVTETLMLSVPISMGDGYTYSKIGFEGTFDLTSLSEGNYVLYMKVTEDNVEKKSEIINYYTSEKPSGITNGDANVRFLINSTYNFRYEIRYDNMKLDFGTINKPNINASIFDFTKLALVDGRLQMDAVSWISGVDSIASTNPAYKLLLIDEKGGVIENNLATKACAVDYAKTMKYKYSTASACFTGDIDLSTLSDGTYVMMLDLSVSGYKDLIELYDYYSRAGQKITFNGKVYEIKISQIRCRLELTISDEFVTQSIEEPQKEEEVQDLPSVEVLPNLNPVVLEKEN